MVKALHRAGIEVILDVVYNHTAEGNHLGPMLSFKGVDNAAYYRLIPDDRRYYMDFTGTGNSLNVIHPSVLRLITDSLRYWVTECHVDGFRFDLASALARELYDVDRLSAFFDVIHQDPVLSQVKLIAEPWDVGPGGYQVGNFPVLWTEWNGIYRDTVRDFWRGHSSAAQLAERLAGSSDLYAEDGRLPSASINFVTAHDGFTLADLVAYNDKHNEANLEDNRDGTDDNRSWNCGAEGPTDDPEIVELRARQQRNLLATLLLSQGVPMLLGGDELGRTQHGNNNAWCQDNELSWLHWDLDDRQQDLLGVHPAADRPAPGPPGVPPRPLPRRRRGPGAARLPLVPRRRPPHDPGELEQRRGAGGRPVPQRRRDGRARPTGTTDRRRLVPRARQRPLRGRRVHAADHPLGAAVVRRAVDRRPGGRGRRVDRAGPPAGAPHEPFGRRRCAASAGRATSPRARSDARAPDDRRRRPCRRRCARHVPAPAARRVRLPRRLGARPLPARPRHLPPLPVAVDDGPPGLDARLRRRSTRTASATSSAARRPSASWPAPGSAVVLDIVPNHLAVGDLNPWWADEAERAQVFDYDPATGWYRRFFDIDDLGGVRQEDPAVFERTHRKVAELLADGTIDGLRVDHPDGLADPAGYLERLAGLGADRVWVEKILHTGEALRPWPVAGTTGYEFLVDATALYVDPAGEEALTALYAELTGETRDVRRGGRRRPSGRWSPGRSPARSSAWPSSPATSPTSRRRRRDVVADALASLPVYRTYVEPSHRRGGRRRS